MVCGVTQLGFIGGNGYTYMRAPFNTINTDRDYFWDMKGYVHLDFDKESESIQYCERAPQKTRDNNTTEELTPQTLYLKS